MVELFGVYIVKSAEMWQQANECEEGPEKLCKTLN
jgi:hypothetical protein